jgi:hypothetical protein
LLEARKPFLGHSFSSIVFSVLHFVQIKDGEELRIQEHCLDFQPVEKTSGEELTKVILQGLGKYSIPLENMIGQA